MGQYLAYGVAATIIVANASIVLSVKWQPSRSKVVPRDSLPPDDSRRMYQPPSQCEDPDRTSRPDPAYEAYQRKYVSIPLSREERRWLTMKRGFMMVAALYLLDLLVLYLLSIMGGPISGSIHGVVKELGGSITIAAAGLFGAFLVMFIVSIAGLRYLIK